MTTETRVKTGNRTRSAGVTVLVGAALCALLIGAGLALVAAMVAGRSAALSVLIGTVLAVGVFAFGAFVVNAVAGLMPAAALLVALLTYTLQVVAMGLVFVVLSGSGGVGAELDRRWLAGAVIACTLTWLVTQLWLATHLRLPAYDLPERGRAEALPGGER